MTGDRGQGAIYVSYSTRADVVADVDKNRPLDPDEVHISYE